MILFGKFCFAPLMHWLKPLKRRASIVLVCFTFLGYLLVPEIVRADPIVAITNIPIATTGGSTITNTDWKGLIFSTPSAVSEISSIQLGLNNISGSYPTSPNIEIGLYSVESGHPSIQLNSLPLQSVSMTESKQMYSFIIPNWQMAANTSYALVLKSDLTSIKWGNTLTIPSGMNGYTYLGFNIYSSGSWTGDGIGSTLNAVVISVTHLLNLLDTQNSLQSNVAALQGVYALQTGTVNNSLNYDCNNFGAKGFCVSTGGRYSNASESTANTTSAMIIAGYKINDHLRIGASADQNLYNTDVAQIASVRSNTPLMGAFVVWNQNADKTGFETKVAAGYNNSDLNVNRSVIGTSEAGQGSTALNTLSESMTTSYAIKLGENYRLSPYAGVRHTSVSANGYAEQSTANVTAPLSYNGLNQESTSALLGVRLAGQVYKNTTVQTSAGFEEDMQNAVNNYSATGIDGLSAITFNPNIQRTRAVVNFGASYELAKGHHLGFNTIYRQESFQGVDTKMAYVNYSMGF